MGAMTMIQSKGPLFITKGDEVASGASLYTFYSSFKRSIQPISLGVNFEYVQLVPDSYVLSMDDASVYSYDGVVLIAGSRIYQDSLWTWSTLFKSPNDIFSVSLPEKKDYVMATIAMSGHANYYHWMTEILPRVYMLQQAALQSPEYAYDVLYVPPLRYSFQKETLRAMGVNCDVCVEAQIDTHIKPKKLLFPSQVAISGITPEWVITFLKTTFLKNYVLKNGKKRLFISRENAFMRKIINEQEIFDCVKEYGFEKVFMEHLTVVEQAELLHEAEYVIGTHGAGMTNIVFARPGTVIIELFQEHLDRTFFDLSQVMGLSYYCIKTKTIEYLSEQDIDIRFRNTCIDGKHVKVQLENVFKKIGLNNELKS